MAFYPKPLHIRDETRTRVQGELEPISQAVAVDHFGDELLLPPKDVGTLCYFVAELRKVGLIGPGDVLVQSWPGFLHFHVEHTDGEIGEDGSLVLVSAALPQEPNEYFETRLGFRPVSRSASERSVPERATPLVQSSARRAGT